MITDETMETMWQNRIDLEIKNRNRIDKKISSDSR